jgi:hypothetical protein
MVYTIALASLKQKEGRLNKYVLTTEAIDLMVANNPELNNIKNNKKFIITLRNNIDKINEKLGLTKNIKRQMNSSNRFMFEHMVINYYIDEFNDFYIVLGRKDSKGEFQGACRLLGVKDFDVNDITIEVPDIEIEPNITFDKNVPEEVKIDVINFVKSNIKNCSNVTAKFWSKGNYSRVYINCGIKSLGYINVEGDL